MLSVHRLGFKLKKLKLLQQFLPDCGLNGIFMMKHIVIIFIDEVLLTLCESGLSISCSGGLSVLGTTDVQQQCPH